MTWISLPRGLVGSGRFQVRAPQPYIERYAHGVRPTPGGRSRIAWLGVVGREWELTDPWQSFRFLCRDSWQ